MDLPRLASLVDVPLLQAYRLLARRHDPGFGFAPLRSGDRTAARARPVVLAQAAVALVTTAGLFMRRTDAPFAVYQPGGDPGFREIPLATADDALSLSPGRFAPDAADRDPEVVLPRRALQALAAEGSVGRVIDPALSFHGHVPDTTVLRDRTAPEAARRLADLGATAAMVVAACPLGAQTAALVAQALERAGVATVVLATWTAPARRVHAPRVVAARHSFGRPLGAPGRRDQHLATLRRALRRLESP